MYRFIDDNGSFSMEKAENYSYLYFPVAGEHGIKSAFTPNWGGDSKLNQNAFILEPVSAENLHNNRSGRNFWCAVGRKGSFSVVGQSAEAELDKFTEDQDESSFSAGMMWQSCTRTSKKYRLSAKTTSFVPLDDNVEIMTVEIINEGDAPVEVRPVAAIPLYGRSADNIRDHRHVTSLLHRIRTTVNGVYVRPTLSFDERGHQKNHLTYYVCAVSGEGEMPESFFPTTESFIGEGGSYTNPRAIREDWAGVGTGFAAEGKEAMGGIAFAKRNLLPKQPVRYTIFIGATENESEIDKIVKKYSSFRAVDEEFARVKAYWKEQVNVWFHTGSERMDNFMRWVGFQPFLRRIYGCSFLPHHDYGKGGRGWRDLWQDCLALLMMNPSGVRQMIIDNFGGVRVDGTNATIIGEKQGEFIADRNNITRVWMDHGMWPFLTTALYLDQTGDLGLFDYKASYFKDKQTARGTRTDTSWNENCGRQQKCADGRVYYGTILEHLLLQNLCAFYEVGEHNHIRLRGADWNDAVDMAEERGESVAFTCAYAGNMKRLAGYIRAYKEKYNRNTVEILREMELLLADSAELYDSVEQKTALLDKYTALCFSQVSGETISVDIDALADNLDAKAEWIMDHIRKTEWITADKDMGWFNGYYDNSGNAVEGVWENGVRMILTSQVFSIMSRTASKEQIAKICRSADVYLYEKEAGGYRLNTNFHEEKYDMGRMFGFAYGEKENGAVFSHMTVMFANALYQNGFVKEGHKALQTLADTALDFETSKIFPGIPEYFNADGRGMYHYLTGAASWYLLTMITEVFGVKGSLGDLILEPKLLAEQFDEKGNAAIRMRFEGKQFEICYENAERKEYGKYEVKEALLDGKTIPSNQTSARISSDVLAALGADIHTITVKLG